MRYFKIENDGIILAIGTGRSGVEISASEYNEVLTALENRPETPDGFGCRLKNDLTWELYELPPVTEEDMAQEADYLAALERFGVT